MYNKKFNYQLQEYRRILKNLAYQFTKNHDEIEDLVQETFVRAFKYMHQFIKNPKVMPWLFVIMRNVYINHYRRCRHKQNYMDFTYHNTTQSHAAPATEDTVEKRIILKEIQCILNKMPIQYGEMFNKHINGYKYRELSEIYGIPEGTIKCRIHLIRKSLQKQFSE